MSELRIEGSRVEEFTALFAARGLHFFGAATSCYAILFTSHSALTVVWNADTISGPLFFSHLTYILKFDLLLVIRNLGISIAEYDYWRHASA